MNARRGISMRARSTSGTTGLCDAGIGYLPVTPGNGCRMRIQDTSICEINAGSNIDADLRKRQIDRNVAELRSDIIDCYLEAD